MVASLRHRIAGVDYLVTFPAGVTARAPGAIQDRFVRHGRPGRDVIRVEVVVGEIPDVSDWRALAASGSMWSIRQNGTQRCLCIGDPCAHPPTGRVALWQGKLKEVTLYCGPEYLAAESAGLEMSYAAGYPVDQVLLMYYLAARGGLLLHAAGLVMDGRALIFPGVSGAGKSTLMQQFLAHGWASLLSDDRVIVRERHGRPIAFGTPWPGDAGVAVNAAAPLAAILFPARGRETRVSELTPQAALDRLLPAASILWHEPEVLANQLDTCERLLRMIPALELSWSLSQGIVDDIRALMKWIRCTA